MTRQISKKRQILEEKLHKQLGTTDEILKDWYINPYPVNKNTISEFWSYVENATYIKIIGDYDVDGVCASHILSTSIREKYSDKKVSVRVPRRFSEGYGINDKIVDEIIETMPKGSLIITVDNGIAARNVLSRLKNAGYKVIVTDHHSVDNTVELPDVDMLIDPAVDRIQNPFTGNYWCGAGVAYKLCETIISKELKKELEVFAGVATVADCMELKEGNWGLVRRAIRTFRKGEAPISLTMLLNKMNQNPKFSNEDHFGFYLGPAINAPGRLLDRGAIEVLKYFYHPTEEQCNRIIDLNNQRKELKVSEFELVKQYIEENNLKQTCPIWVSIEGLHEGIVGILAGMVAEEYKKPAIVLTNVEEKPGIIKGSGRNYGDFNIFEYLCEIKDLFIGMGGHKGAAGLSLNEENFEKARLHQVNFKEENVIVEQESPDAMIIEKWEIPGMHTSLNKFRPFGEGNLAPKFEIEIDLDSKNDVIRMLGEKEEHLLIEDKYKKYKITHWSHSNSELQNPSNFGMTGVICGTSFAGKETPTFNAEHVFDIEESDYEIATE